MPRAMRHWNGNQMCAIDCETTGLDPQYHEMWQLAIIPLDSDIKPRKDVLPFYVEMQIEFPERMEDDFFKKQKSKILRASQMGLDKEKAKEVLFDWIEKLELPCTKWGNPKRITPLGQNYPFDMGFLRNWLGHDLYEEYFNYHHVDTMVAAAFINDWCAMHAEPVMFNKINLAWLCKKLNVELDHHHDALADAKATAGVYRAMLQLGLLG